MPGGALHARMASLLLPAMDQWRRNSLVIIVSVFLLARASDAFLSGTLSDGAGRLNVSALEYGQLWQSWKSTHGRSYVTIVEELERYVIWRANQAFIDYHNSYAHKLGFTLRMNQFGDLVSICLLNGGYSSKERCSLPRETIPS